MGKFLTKYGMDRIIKKMPQIAQKKSLALQLFNVKLDGMFLGEEGEGVENRGQILVRRPNLIEPATIREIEKSLGCPEYTYECVGGDEYITVELSHEISKGIKYNNCSLKVTTGSKNTAEMVKSYTTLAVNFVYEKLDEAVFDTINGSAPSITVKEDLSKDNILETVTKAGLYIENDGSLGKFKSTKKEITILVPLSKQEEIEAAMLDKMKCNMELSYLTNGIATTRIKGYTITFADVPYIMAFTKDAYTVALACYEAPTMQFWQDKANVEGLIAFKAGGGYNYQIKNKETNKEMIRKIVIMKTPTGLSGNGIEEATQPATIVNGFVLEDEVEGKQ